MGKRQHAELVVSTLMEKVKVLNSRVLPCPSCCATEHLFCTNPDIEEMVCCCISLPPVDEPLVIGGKERGGQVKSEFDVTDVESTGRKRCAILFPLTDDMICEWAKLKEAGGGVEPIIGCLGNKATNRHHGPDKNTLNNKPENVHRICTFCHNYWHARNDEFYGKRPGGTEPFIPLGDHAWSGHNYESVASPEELVIEALRRKK